MTSLLRTKRPTTAPAGSTPARTPASVLGLALFLAAGAASAQEPRPLPPLAPSPWQPAAPDIRTLRHQTPPPPAAEPVRTLLFHKPSGGPRPPEAQQVQGTRPPGGVDIDEFQAQIEPPDFARLIRLESEDALRERMRQEKRDRGTGERSVFPEDRPITEDRFASRKFPNQKLVAEPNYVCYRRLFFEEKNAERYGWDVGGLQPFLSAGAFFSDFVTLPYHMASGSGRCCETGAGECLPGDPVPYLLYPPGLSAKGALAEAGAILGLVAIFP